jgi:hypothetical protein
VSRDDSGAEEIDGLIAGRRAANPRHSPGREPAGSATTRRLVTLTAAAVLLATAVLVAVLLLA